MNWKIEEKKIEFWTEFKISCHSDWHTVGGVKTQHEPTTVWYSYDSQYC